jgi:hypothetical protein
MLSLGDLLLDGRIFGWHGVWSSDARYFVIAEWLHVHTADYPDMQLVIIDVPAGTECVVETVPGGYVDPMYIFRDTIKYTKLEEGMDDRVAVNCRIADLTGWRPVQSAENERRRSKR